MDARTLSMTTATNTAKGLLLTGAGVITLSEVSLGCLRSARARIVVSPSNSISFCYEQSKLIEKHINVRGFAYRVDRLHFHIAVLVPFQNLPEYHIESKLSVQLGSPTHLGPPLRTVL